MYGIQQKNLLSSNPTCLPRLKLRTVFGDCTLVPAISSPKKKLFCRHCSVTLSSRATETIVMRTQSQDSSRCCGLCCCNLLAERNNFGLCTILSSPSVSELQKSTYRKSNSGQLVGGRGSFSVISTSSSASFFHLAYFPSRRKS